MLSFCFFIFLLFFVILSKLKRTQYCSKLALLFKIQRPNKGDEMARSMERLPQELVSNVLSRLPARELLKCKCVCKSWFGLITNPDFVTNYHVVYNNLMHHHSQEQHLLVIKRPSISDLRTSISVLSWNSHDPKTSVSSALLKTPDEYNSDHKYWSRIMGPCNGIYFLEGNPNVMMNPSLRQFKTLPESHFTSQHGTYSLTDYAGFGFDPKTDDYKVVVLKDLWLKETDERRIGYWNAELYSLKSNNWNKLDADASSIPLPNIEIWGSSRVHTYVNNCCHWWGFETHGSGKTEDVVLSFDMVNEAFRKISVPKIRESSKEAFAMLVPFEESSAVGVIVYPVRGSTKHFDIWVMRDYWDKGSWVKQYSVGPVEVIGKLVVVGFIGNRFLWKCSDQEGLVLLDVRDSRKTRVLNVYGKFDLLRAAIYEESLVSLERGNEFSRQFVSQ